MSLSEARKRIFEIAEEAQAPHNIFTFTEHGKPKVVMMSAEEYESWQETMDVIREVPEIFERIEEAKNPKNLVEFEFKTPLRKKSKIKK